MARKLHLYNFIKPNAGNERHYMFSNPANYVSFLDNYIYLGSSVNFLNIDYPNYRIINGRVLLSGHFAVREKALMNATYIVDYDDGTGVMFAYWVKSIRCYSELVEINVERDEWATGFSGLTFENVHITRCNRNIGDGLYDLPPATKNPLKVVDFFGFAAYSAISNYYLVMKLRHVVEVGYFGNQDLTTDMLVAIKLSDFDALFTSAASQNFTILDLAARFCGGVYGVSTLVEFANLKANVLEAWIIPAFFLNVPLITPPLTISVKSKVPYVGGGDVTASCVPVSAGRKYAVFNLRDLDITHKWFCGGLSDGLQFQMPTDTNAVMTCYFDTSTDNIKITLCLGDVQKDVSNEFTIPIIGSGEVADGLQKLSVIAKELSTGISRGMSLISTKTGGEMAAKGAQIGLDYLSRFTDRSGQSLTGQNVSGSGSVNYSVTFNNGWVSLSGRTNYVYSPLKFIGFPSMRDEETHAWLKGAQFDLYNSNFSTIDAATHLGADPLLTLRDDTFIAVDNFDLYGCDVDVESYVRSEFLRGIYIYCL